MPAPNSKVDIKKLCSIFKILWKWNDSEFLYLKLFINVDRKARVSVFLVQVRLINEGLVFNGWKKEKLSHVPH